MSNRIISARIGPVGGEDPTREQQIDLCGDGPTTEVEVGGIYGWYQLATIGAPR